MFGRDNEKKHKQKSDRRGRRWLRGLGILGILSVVGGAIAKARGQGDKPSADTPSSPPPAH